MLCRLFLQFFHLSFSPCDDYNIFQIRCSSIPLGIAKTFLLWWYRSSLLNFCLFFLKLRYNGTGKASWRWYCFFAAALSTCFLLYSRCFILLWGTCISQCSLPALILQIFSYFKTWGFFGWFIFLLIFCYFLFFFFHFFRFLKFLF